MTAGESEGERKRENEAVREGARESVYERKRETQEQGHAVFTYAAHCYVSEQSQRVREGREGARKRGGVCMHECVSECVSERDREREMK